MPTDRVLIEIVTAANMAGVTEAKAGFLGMNPAALGLGLALGGLVAAGKSAIDVSREHAQAEKSLELAISARNAAAGKVISDPIAAAAEARDADALSKAEDSLTLARNAAVKSTLAYNDAVHKHGAESEQARIAAMNLQDANIRLKQAQDGVATSQDKLTASQQRASDVAKTKLIVDKDVQDELAAFIEKNRDYISNQADVIQSTAALVRQGTSLADIQRDQNLILDLAAAKQISLADATEIVLKAQSGQFKGLKDLLGLTAEAIPKSGSLADKEKAVADNMDAAAAAVKGARDQIDPLQKSSNDLNNDWTNLANTAGPALVEQISNVAKAADDGYKKLNAIGNDDAMWGKIQDRILKLGDLPLMAFLLSGRSADLSHNQTMQQIEDWVHNLANTLRGGSTISSGIGAAGTAAVSRQRGFTDYNFTA